MVIGMVEAQQQVFVFLTAQEESDPAVLATDSFYDPFREGKSEEDLVVYNYVIDQIKMSAAQQPEPE